MSDDKKVIFSMSGVSKILPSGKQILKDIYLSFFYGAKIGILGLNGAGKSTLLKIIAGIDKSYQGDVVFSPGYSVEYLEQEPELDDDKTVKEIIQEGVQETVDVLAEYEEINNLFMDSEILENPDKMEKLMITPSKVSNYGVNIAKDGVKRSAIQLLSQKSVNMSKIREIWPEINYISREIDEQLEINSHYRGYLKKQNADILAFKRDENLIIPENLDYDRFSGLSNEVKTKFKKIRPKTMGQALRIDGITPAAVYILLSHLKRKSIKHIA